MTAIRAAATKTKQIARRADINLELQRLQLAYADARSKL
jgi:hypothetical protein